MTTDRDVEKELSVEDFVAELRRLADALEAGNDYELEIDGEAVSLPENAVFSIEHEREDGSHEIEFQISWSDDTEEDEDDDAEDDEEVEEDEEA